VLVLEQGMFLHPFFFKHHFNIWKKASIQHLYFPEFLECRTSD